MKVEAVHTPRIEKGQNLSEIFFKSVNKNIKEKTVICVTSKVVALEQNRIVRLSDIRPSEEARQMKEMAYSKHVNDHAQFAELVLQESERVFDGEDGLVYLTFKNSIFIANAGIDLSNAPDGYAILLPEKPWDWTKNYRDKLKSQYNLEHLGVLMTDSHLTPLRQGVTGLALAYSGFEGVESQIGKLDLFNKPLHITAKAVADDLASAAVLVTGEAGESTPFVIIQDAPITFTHRDIDPVEILVDPKFDFYSGIYNKKFKNLLDMPKKHFQ